ncbi:MAG: hypothetical protein Q9227_008802 [Pyrenula ochraceoflavens]
MASEALFQQIPPFPEDVRTADMSTISLASLISGDAPSAKNMLEACQKLGFFLLDLRGDKLGEALSAEIDKLFAAGKEIMNLPHDVKEQYKHQIPKSFLGFKPRGEAKTESNEPDRFEWFNLGQDGLLRNSDLQPLPPVIKTYIPLFTSFLHHGQSVVSTICQSLATSLSLPPSTFTDLQPPTKPSGTVIRLIKADPSPNPTDLRTSMIHHTDFGTVTLLANVLGGLQILDPGKSPADKDAWLYVRPRPHCLVVNLGDAMVQWTGGLLKSNVHRINYAPGMQRLVERYSLAMLVRPEREASMKRLVGGETEEKDEGEGLTAWEWEVKKAMALKREVDRKGQEGNEGETDRT